MPTYPAAHEHVRPFALGYQTILLHLLGDSFSPPNFGALLDAWAPDCKVVLPPNASAVPAAGEPPPMPRIDPACFGLNATNASAWANGTSVPHGGHFSEQQYGLLAALLLAALYMLTTLAYWGAASALLARRIQTEKVCPPLGGGHGPRGADDDDAPDRPPSIQ